MPPARNSSSGSSRSSTTLAARFTRSSAKTTEALPASVRRQTRTLAGRVLYLNPIQRALNGFAPSCIARRALVIAPPRRPPLALLPLGPQLVGAGPEVDCQPGRVRCSQRCGLGHDRPDHVDTQHVGLNLHAQLVGGDPPVDL